MTPGTSGIPGARLRLEPLEDRATPAAGSAAYLNVVTASDIKSENLEGQLAAVSGSPDVDYLGFGIYRVAVVPGMSSDTAVSLLSGQRGVVSVTPDTTIQIASSPKDSSYTSQYALTKINAPAAWDVTTGAKSFVVAVLDTGIDVNHPDLAANLWTNPGEVAGNGKDDDANGFIDDVHGWDFVNDDNNPSDDNEHGTHVSGIIGAVGNNSRGVTGVNWAVSIVPLKFIGAGGRGETSDAIAALNYAVSMGVKVSNNSWADKPADSALAAAISRARLAGHIFVAAAGNGGTDGIGDNIDVAPNNPASYSKTYNNVVAVAATDSQDRLASFSNYGVNSVMLAAPGVGILSTTPGDTYRTQSGTSMATPQVTGAIALLWSQHPNWNYVKVIDKLKASVDPVAGLVGKVQTGGRLNVGRMLQGTTPIPDAAPGPVVTSAVFSGNAPSNLTKVRFTFARSVDPASFTAADVKSFIGPSGAISTNFTVAVVPGTSNKQFDVTFAPRTASGSYSMMIGPDIRDATGHLMNQDADRVGGELADRYTAAGSLRGLVSRILNATTVPQSISDLQTTRSTITVTERIRITDLSVRLSLLHSYDGELTIRLVSPTGIAITLFQNRGVNGDNLTRTVFADHAVLSISDPTVRAPFTGTFRPEQPLSTFDGLLATGTWTLEITDRAKADTGTLLSWSMTLAGTLGTI